MSEHATQRNDRAVGQAGITRCLDIHAHHVGKPVIDRIQAEGAQHEVKIVKGEDGATRISVGGRLTGMPLIPPLSDETARLKWMDEAGIDVQLLSGWMDLAGYHLPTEAGLWLARVQNEALAEMVAQRPDRYAAAAMVPLQDAALAATELRHAVQTLGHRAVQIGARVEEEGLDAPQFDAFWAAAQELNVPVIIHPADLAVPPRMRRLFLHILVGNPSETTFAAAALLLGGVFDRFPKLQIFWAENNIGWIPYFYQQMDQTYKVNRHWAERLLGLPKLKKLPSEYLREHAHWGVFDDPIGIHLRHMVGVDKIMWSTDFPHIVTRWPKSLELVEEQFAGVPEDERSKMLAGNAVKFFHLDAA